MQKPFGRYLNRGGFAIWKEQVSILVDEFITGARNRRTPLPAAQSKYPSVRSNQVVTEDLRTYIEANNQTHCAMKTFVTFCLLIVSLATYSQSNYRLKGKVYDKATGDEVIGAVVLVTDTTGTETSTLSDVGGMFAINLKHQGPFASGYHLLDTNR